MKRTKLATLPAQKILEALTYLTDGEVKPTMSVPECLWQRAWVELP